MSRRFEGRVAVVTGAASGLGRATALRLSKEGARLLLFDQDEAHLAATAAQCADCVAVVGDAASAADLGRAEAVARRDLGLV